MVVPLAVGCSQPLLSGADSGAAAKPAGGSPTGELPAPPPPANGANAGAAKPKVIVINTTFDVLRVRVPQGVLSESGKVWNHIETDFLPGETIKLLHRNGLRVGRGKAESWPPIKAILETEARVISSQSRLTVNNGLPLLLELDLRPKDQLLFIYRRDGTMAGAPWRSTTNLLRIEYGIAPTDPEALLVEIMPELRLDSGESGAAAVWNVNPAANERSLVVRDLAFQAQLPPGQFVAIGPSSVTNELPYVMGSLLLCDESGGEKFESMYFVTPTVSRAGGATIAQ